MKLNTTKNTNATRSVMIANFLATILSINFPKVVKLVMLVTPRSLQRISHLSLLLEPPYSRQVLPEKLQRLLAMRERANFAIQLLTQALQTIGNLI